MNLSFILNTAALDPRITNRHNPHRKHQYGLRKELVRTEILPTVLADDFDEVIVCGVFEPGEGYEYIELQPRYRDRRDALWQREIGFRRSTGEVLVFCHDDHRPSADFARTLREIPDGDWDILVPKRVHGRTGEELNNGHSKFSALDGRSENYIEEGYMGGHCLVMRRWVPATIRWNCLDTEFWDLPMSDLWREAGAEIRWTDRLAHIDLEAGRSER